MMMIITPHAVDVWNDLLCPSLSVLLLKGLNYLEGTKHSLRPCDGWPTALHGVCTVCVWVRERMEDTDRQTEWGEEVQH